MRQAQEAQGREQGQGTLKTAAALALTLLSLLLALPGTALALVEPPVTVDGPNNDVLEIGNTALASDGSGGLVYLKIDQGVPHVFAARRLRGGAWAPPVRVDSLPYDASEPAVAASDKGRLLVVWVSQIATVHGQVRRALYSAELGPGAGSFGPPLVVDPDVAKGQNVDPSLAGTEPGRAIVAYRVITNDFGPLVSRNNAVQLRPGDVIADVRAARYQGTRWSRLGAINRNPEASFPAPTAANRPQVGLANDGSAVVAWQERDQSISARIWARRIFGTSLGPILLASPTTWQGQQVTRDADALALAVSPLGMAQVVARIPGGTESPTRVFADQLPAGVDEGAATFAGAVAADGGPLSGPVGPPAVAVSEQGKASATSIAFTAGSALRSISFGNAPSLSDPPPAPAPTPGSAVALAGSTSGGSVAAWVTAGADGLPAVAVRQQNAAGTVQTGVLSGAGAGVVSGLSMASNEGGDAVVSFLQTTGTGKEVVAEGISAAPARFTVQVPRRWVRPSGARLRWEAAPSANAPLTYTVLLDGDPVASGTRRALTPPPIVLGNGVRKVQVLATDAQGQAVASDPVKLKVDARPPSAKVAGAPAKYGPHAIAVTVADPDSGVAKTTCAFGDGTGERGRRRFQHSYDRPGRYFVRVTTRDRAGNATSLRLGVQVR